MLFPQLLSRIIFSRLLLIVVFLAHPALSQEADPVQQMKAIHERIHEQINILSRHKQFMEQLDVGRLLFLKKASERLQQQIQKKANSRITIQEVTKATHTYLGLKEAFIGNMDEELPAGIPKKEGLVPEYCKNDFTLLFKLAKEVGREYEIDEKTYLTTVAAETLARAQTLLEIIYQTTEGSKTELAAHITREILTIQKELRQIIPKAEVQGDSHEAMEASIKVVSRLRKLYPHLNQFNPIRTTEDNPIKELQGAIESYVDTVRLEEGIQKYEKAGGRG